MRATAHPIGPDPFSDEVESAFLEQESFWTAADLVSVATVRQIRSDAAKSAASFIVNHADSGSPAFHSAQTFMEVEHGADTQPLDMNAEVGDKEAARIGRLRRLLSESPRNPLRWVDLALAHTSVGNRSRADRAMRTALAMAPQNRFVLRSAARFFVHSGKGDEALHWLNHSEGLLEDPWLLSAQIAVSQVVEAPTKHVRAARELLNDGSISPISSSELFAVLSTEELIAGRDKPARQFMASALIEPTDNAVAQAVWGSEHGLDELSQEALEVPRTFEARTLQSMQDEDWSRAIDGVQFWLRDEPFSLRASLHATYISSSGLQDFAQAINFAFDGLRINPGNLSLINNGAFALANAGRAVDALALLNSAKSSGGALIDFTMDATRGLVEFRMGNFERGRDLYRGSADAFRKAGRGHDLAALCLVMWAREEVLANTEAGGRLLAEASEVAQRGTSRDAKLWLERIRRQLRSPS